jgi:hypothetical protein
MRAVLTSASLSGCAAQEWHRGAKPGQPKWPDRAPGWGRIFHKFGSRGERRLDVLTSSLLATVFALRTGRRRHDHVGGGIGAALGAAALLKLGLGVVVLVAVVGLAVWLHRRAKRQ